MNWGQTGYNAVMFQVELVLGPRGSAWLIRANIYLFLRAQAQLRPSDSVRRTHFCARSGCSLWNVIRKQSFCSPEAKPRLDHLSPIVSFLHTTVCAEGFCTCFCMREFLGLMCKHSECWPETKPQCRRASLFLGKLGGILTFKQIHFAKPEVRPFHDIPFTKSVERNHSVAHRK